MTWFKELRFATNPLDIRPNPNIIGLKEQEKEIINYILKEDICFVNGLTGSGKSSMLKRIQRILKNHEFIYLDAHDLPPKFSLEKELKKKRSFFDKLAFREFPKQKPVLIIDEFQSTDPRLILNARSKWEDPDKRIIKSIVVAQISRHLDNCSSSFKERIGSKIVEMRTLTNDELKEMLKRRLYCRKLDTNFAARFNDDALDLIVKSAGKNPRKVLEYTEIVFDYHHKKFGDINPVKRADYVISPYVVKQVLEESNLYVENIKDLKSAKLKQEESNKQKQEELNKQKQENSGKQGQEENKYYKPAQIEQTLEQKSEQKLEQKEFITANITKQLNDGLEKEILKYINKEPRTVKDIAKQFNLSNNHAKKEVDILRKENHLVAKNKKGRMKLWEVAPETKRLLVES
ncbi:hypothetical protein J4434_02820 [Candidatus Woesearchaeota archaeon]|nr:hypothetical protein [Candidatus Woesearchaeota archaeon]